MTIVLQVGCNSVWPMWLVDRERVAIVLCIYVAYVLVNDLSH